MTRVVLQGSYFGHNFGDVLLLSLYTKWIKETVEGSEVILPKARADTVTAIGADSGRLSNIFGSRGLIYAGGGYFGEPPGSPLRVHRWSIRNFYRHMPSGGMLTLLGRPIAVIGAGAGPVSNPIFRLTLRKLLERAVIVAVRDEESKDFLRSIGVSRNDIEVTADAALCVSTDDIPEECLADVRNRFPSRDANLIGVHLPARGSFSEDVETVLNGIETVMNKHRDFEIVVMSDKPGYNPQLLARRFAARYPNRVHIARYKDPWTLVALLSELRMVITTKLHVGIVATAVGTLPLSFPYHHKTQRFYRQIGASELCHPLRSVDRERVVNQFDLALGMVESKNYRYKLPHQIRNAAQRNKELVGHFMGIINENAQ